MVTKVKIAIIAGIAIVAVVGITLGIVYGTKGDDDDDGDSCGEFNAPILELNVVDDMLVASWQRPDNFKDCSVKYNLKYAIDGVDSEVKDITETKFEFVDLELVPCTEVIVILTAINGDGVESDRAKQIYLQSVDDDTFADVAVTGINIDLKEKDALVQWGRPTGFDACDMQYEVSIDDVVQTITSDTDYGKSLEYCTSPKISVVPIIGKTRGQSASDQKEVEVSSGFAEVSSLELKQDGDKVKATWKKPIGFDRCVIKYKLVYNDVEEPTPIEVTQTEYDLLVCVDYKIEVTPVIGVVVGKTDSKDFKSGVDDDTFADVAVTGINIDLEGKDAIVEWGRPTGFDACDMQYEVSVDDVVQTIISDTEYPISLEYCTSPKISVVPIIGETRGQSASDQKEVEVSSGFAKVSSLEFKQDGGKVKATWGKPTGFDECVIKYKVVYNDVEEPTPIEDPQIEYDFLVCVDYKIEVTPLIGDIVGETDSNDFKSGVDDDTFADVAVTGMNIDLEGKDAIVEWGRPTGFDACDMQYEVSVDDVVQTIISDTEYPISLEYCTSPKISVVPIIGEARGQSASDQKEVEVSSGFGKVSSLELKQDGDKVKATWVKPDGFDGCVIKYKLVYNDVEDPTPIEVTQKEYDLLVCADYKIEVTPVIGDVVGETDSKDFKSGVDDDTFADVAVTGINIDLEGKEAIVEWGRPTGFDACDMQYEVSVDDVVQTIISDTEYPISLEYCTSPKISVVPVIGETRGQSASDQKEVEVSSGFAKVSSLELKQDGDKVKATWVKPDGFDGCVIRYKLGYNDVEEPTLIEVTQTEYDLLVCVDYKIEVTPVIGDVVGETDSKNFKSDLTTGFAQVSSLDITQSAKEITVAWDELTGYENCGAVTYKLMVDDEINENVMPGFTTSLEYCVPTKISVLPVIDNIEGAVALEETQLDIPESFGAVTGFFYEAIASELLLEWVRPDGFDACDMNYRVTIGDESKDTSETKYTTAFEYCVAMNIQIVPFIDETNGLQHAELVVVSPRDIGEVTALTVEIKDNEYKATWGKPSELERCTLNDVIYTVVLKQGSETLDNKSDLITEYAFILTDECASELPLELTVTAKYGDDSGQATNDEQTCPEESA